MIVEREKTKKESEKVERLRGEENERKRCKLHGKRCRFAAPSSSSIPFSIWAGQRAQLEPLRLRAHFAPLLKALI